MKSDQTNDSRYRAAELGALLARHYPDAAPHMIARVVFDMQSAAKLAKRFAAAESNGELDQGMLARRAKRQEENEGYINAQLSWAKLGLFSFKNAPSDGVCDHPLPATITLGGDPRGPCARLHIPGQRGDGWGEGFAIF